MNDDLVDILSHSNKDIDNQKLMDYLSKNSSAEEEHELEKEMINSEFVNDAVEGLESFSSKEDLSNFVKDLNTKLQKQIEDKKKRKQKRKIKEQPWVLLALILIILLTIVCLLVIRKLSET